MRQKQNKFIDENDDNDNDDNDDRQCVMLICN